MPRGSSDETRAALMNASEGRRMASVSTVPKAGHLVSLAFILELADQC